MNQQPGLWPFYTYSIKLNDDRCLVYSWRRSVAK